MVSARSGKVELYSNLLEELGRRRQRNRVAEWYGGMEHGSAGAWDQVKRGFVTAYGELDSAFVKAAKEFERG